MLFVRLAFRNVLRNARRSTITILAIAVGITALLFMWSFIDGVNEQMIDNSTRYLSGHLQVHRSGYHDDQTLDLTLADGDSMAARVLQATGPATKVTRRLEAFALASAGDKSRSVGVLGINPVSEQTVTTLASTVIQGRFLDPLDRDGVVVGSRIAEALGIKVGSELILVSQAADGSTAAGRFLVRGVFHTRMDMFDGSYVLMTLPAAQDLYVTGEAVTSIVMRLADRAAITQAASQLRSDLGPGYEVLDWAQLMPAVQQSVSFHEVTGYVLLLVLFIVVSVGITNTVLMGVMERNREFGVMMALGTSRLQVTRLVFYEACLLGAGGLALGTVAGLSLAGYYARTGMDFEQYVRAMETMQGLSAVIYPAPRWDRGLLIIGVVFLLAVLAALYPAWRTARLVPVAAIRNLPEENGRSRSRHAPRGWRLQLPLILCIAIRSIGRNPHRTALTVTGSAFGVAAFIFIASLAQGYLREMVENSTGYLTGHLQVQHPRFRTEIDPANSLAGIDDLLAALRGQPQVVAAAPRVQSMALASSAGKSQNMMLLGIDPKAERDVTFMHRAVRQGQFLSTGDGRDIVLGDRLAEKLGLRLGDKLVVMVQSADGNVGSAAYRLTGLFDTGSDAFDARLGYITLSAAQALTGMPDRASAVAVRLNDLDKAEAGREAIQRLLTAEEAVAVSWRGLLPELDQMTEYLRVVLRLITGIVLAVVAIGVMNTLLMSVMERTRELGIMMALGTPPHDIVRLVIYEASVLTGGGIALGWAAGFLLVQWLNVRGLDLSRYAKGLQSIPGLTGVVHPLFVPASLLGPTLFLLAISVLAALYPAWRAARLHPTEAIRHA